jgi:ABC-2 type transport system ATP-binding protein
MKSSAQNNSTGLVVAGVSKRYGRPRLLPWLRGSVAPRMAMTDVSFAVHDGEMFGLLGPNGAGKTTLLKMIAGLSVPTAGSISLNGIDVYRHPKQIQRSLGLVTCDERSFYWRLTGRQNLEFFATLYGIPTAQAKRRMDELFEALTLTDAADRRYAGYSSGMKQKLAIARGLLGNPRLVLFDEPTRSLDPLSAARIREWIRNDRLKNRERIQILATNLLNEAEMLCDRVLILNHGRILATGTMAELRLRWQGGYQIHTVHFEGGPVKVLPPESERDREGFVGMEQNDSRKPMRSLVLRAVQGSPALSHALTEILANGGKILECSTKVATLDEIFCSLLQPESAPLAGESRSGHDAEGNSANKAAAEVMQ